MKQAVPQFRYWIDEPGNDVMWSFSENHALLFHVCQYYVGKLYPVEVSESSGLTDAKQSRKAEALLETWSDSFEKEHITEWNSNAYVPVDVLGPYGLYNLTEKEDR